MRSFNEAWALKETLPALKVQDLANWELIIVDSGSTDGSQEPFRIQPQPCDEPRHETGTLGLWNFPQRRRYAPGRELASSAGGSSPESPHSGVFWPSNAPARLPSGVRVRLRSLFRPSARVGKVGSFF